MQNSDNYREKAIENENKAKQLLKDIKKKYREDPAVMAEMFFFGANFYQYSPNNISLIHSQNGGATYCQSYAAWKKMGYHVKKGEHGLKIWVPVQQTVLKIGNEEVPLSSATKNQKEEYKKGHIKAVQRLHFKLGNVFDISQTDYPKEDYPKLFSMGFNDDQYKMIFTEINRFSREKLKCPVLIQDLKSISLRGCYYAKDNVIKINNRLNDSERLSTLCHELGHAFIHNINSDRANKTTSQRELEADALSIMLQSNFELPLTASRKRHFVQHYESFISECNEKKIDVDERLDIIFGNVYKIFKENISEIDRYVSSCIKQEEEISISAQNVKIQSEQLTDNLNRLKKDMEESDKMIEAMKSASFISKNMTNFVTQKKGPGKEGMEKIKDGRSDAYVSMNPQTKEIEEETNPEAEIISERIFRL